MSMIYKSGSQSSQNPFEFVLSTASVDRMGDIVEQDFDLDHFLKNPIALWGHKSNELPIGIWENVRIEGGKLLGELKLAAKGTSEFIDTLRSLVEQRVLRAVSIGFRAGKAKPRGKSDGYILSENQLLEVSLVNIPANAEALSTMKSLSLSEDQRALLVEEDETRLWEIPAAKQLEAQDSVKESRVIEMTISERIKELQKSLVAFKDQADQINTERDKLEDSDPERDVLKEQLIKCFDEIARVESEIELKQKHEQIMARNVVEQEKAAPVERRVAGELMPREEAKPVSYMDETETQNLPGLSRRGMPERMVAKGDWSSKKAPGDRVISALSCMLRGHLLRANPLMVARHEYQSDPSIEMLLRAATVEADTTTAGWAAELVQESWSGFLDLIYDLAFYPRLPGIRLTFGRNGKIHYPHQASKGDLAGDFVGEGNPIPVKQGSVGGVTVMAHALKVISTFTKELQMHSSPEIEGLIRQMILRDTAQALDARFLEDTAASPVRPAGLENAVGAANVNTASGATTAAILADTRAMKARMRAAGSGTGGVWLMHPDNADALADLQDAASGAFTFRDSVMSGTFQRMPLIESENVPNDKIYLIGERSFIFASDYAPRFDVSDQATLVFEDDVTKVENLVGGTGKTPPAAGTATAMPVRSMYQVDSVAVKMTAGLSWAITNPASSQVLDGVSL